MTGQSSKLGVERWALGVGRFLLAICLLVAAENLQAQPPVSLQDPFLDQLVGDWKVTRKFPNGRAAENTVHAAWVLNHQFLQLHYQDTVTPPKYEALVYLGFDNPEHAYVCHWVDVYGGSFSALGHGKLDSSGESVEINFEPKDGALTNRFTFDRKTGNWTSLIRQQEKGEWKIFCEDTFTKTGGAR